MQLKDGELANANPLTSDQFDQIMSSLDLGKAQKIAVAVSGGSDSMALALLLHEWCITQKKTLIALTVDHGLRENSASEAKRVKDWMRAKNISHHILTWSGLKPDADIQNEARKARYHLMGQWCADNDVKYLCVAHHKEDQAETFLMRLFRGSGIDGLSAMDTKASFPVEDFDNKYPLICRPLLDISKQRLIDTLCQFKQTWVDDPSNENDSFTRIKTRNLLKSTDIEGFNSERLSQTAKRIRRVRSLLEDMTIKAESDYAKHYDLGFTILNLSFLENTHEEISLRLLSTILKKISGGQYAPRLIKLENLFENLKASDFMGQTIYGVVVFPVNENEIAFVREAKSIQDENNITDQKRYLWDNRFVVTPDKMTGKLKKLNTNNINILSDKFPDLKAKLNLYFDNHLLQKRVLSSLPCIHEKEGAILLPDILAKNIGMQELDKFSTILKK